MTIRRFVSLGALLALAVLGMSAIDVKGTVSDTGFGKIVLTSVDGTELPLSLSAKKTAYSPEDWRPHEGDTLKAVYQEISKNKGVVLEVASLTLVSAGTLSKELMADVVTISVLDANKKAIKGKLQGSKAEIRFEYPKGGPAYTPANAMPIPGQKAEITFAPVKATFGYGLVYVATKVKILK